MTKYWCFRCKKKTTWYSRNSAIPCPFNPIFACEKCERENILPGDEELKPMAPVADAQRCCVALPLLWEGPNQRSETGVEVKYVTVSMNLKQAEAVLSVIGYAIEEKIEWTNACRRRLDGVRRSLSAVVREAEKNIRTVQAAGGSIKKSQPGGVIPRWPRREGETVCI